ncbi:MAG: glucose-6-phosphate dehydrogenase assembly protein OpcA [Deltaproteobacteria bacterium]|nr:glucose-6-phosphate dehydrogenase assembly protein OpcA [Deltaproteobacteria bacterium]
MALRYDYIPTSLDGISSALTKLFSSLETKDKTFNRAAHSNVIIPVSAVGLLESIESEIDTLSLVHPSRFFVVYLDEAQPVPTASVSARCHALSKTEHVCSEVVRIACSRAGFVAVPSLIRANSLTDMATEVYLADVRVPADVLNLLIVPGNTLILDSANFEQRYDELDHLEHLVGSVLDLQWVGLGLWRDEIKDLFGRPLVREYTRAVRSVEISSSSASGSDGPAALLLAGWIAGRLGLSRTLTRVEDGVLCSDGGGRELKVKFNITRASGPSKLSEVLFTFDPLRVGSSPQSQYIRLRRNGEALETMVDLNVSYRTTRPFDDESAAGRIRRYFLIGESMTNYTAASRVALEVARLRATPAQTK